MRKYIFGVHGLCNEPIFFNKFRVHETIILPSQLVIFLDYKVKSPL